MTTHSKQEKFAINGKTFISNKWSIFTAANHLPKIGKVFVVPVSFIFSAIEESNLKEAVPQAAYMLFEQLEEHDLRQLLSIILHDVHNGGQKVDIEKDFDDLSEVIELVAKVLEQQYGVLIKGKSLKALASLLLPLTQAAQSQ